MDAITDAVTVLTDALMDTLMDAGTHALLKAGTRVDAWAVGGGN